MLPYSYERHCVERRRAFEKPTPSIVGCNLADTYYTESEGEERKPYRLERYKNQLPELIRLSWSEFGSDNEKKKTFIH